VCPNVILSATLFQLLCIPVRVLRVALLVCTARPFLSYNVTDGVIMMGFVWYGGCEVHVLDILAGSCNVLYQHCNGARRERSPNLSANYLHILRCVSRQIVDNIRAFKEE